MTATGSAQGMGGLGPAVSADDGPVAVVAVDIPLPHLDRPFEYLVPPELSEAARPGARVKVRFAGQDVSGFILARAERAEHEGRLTPLRRVVSPEAVLTPRIAALVRAVADAHAGTFADVVRLAVPPRHAAAERALTAHPPQAGGPVPAPEGRAWARYPAGPSLLRRLTDLQRPSAAWSVLPTIQADVDWPYALAEAAAATLAGGRGALLVVPDAADVQRVEDALLALLGPGHHVRLTAAQGPQARYTAWLKVLRGHVRCVVGTRAAAYAPVADLGLVAWWDDGDDSFEEPRAPYAHARDVLSEHARLAGAAVLIGGFARSVDTALAVRRGDLRQILPDPVDRRAAAPRVHVAGEGSDEERDGPAARVHLPGAAWRAATAALRSGPVLVQVPRSGYVPSLACQTCRAPARCPNCAGPVGLLRPGAAPTCRWCGHGAAAHWTCPTCGGTRLRSSTVGARRTAEELGRAFPGITVKTSGSGEVLATVPADPVLVIATPGAEPRAEGGYAAVLLLDAWTVLDRPALDAAQEALRRWSGAAALARPGAPVVIAGAPSGGPVPAIEALIRWDPEWFADRELTEREQLRLPPAAWVASLNGSRVALRDLMEAIELPEGVERLGPQPVTGAGDEHLHILLRADPGLGPRATAALAAARAVRSARKDPGTVQVQVGRVQS